MFTTLLAKRPEILKDDLLSGLTVALALVPEAVAFAMVAQVPIMVGLHAAFLIGLIAAALGGRPGMISGATGAMAVVLLGLHQALHIRYGWEIGIKTPDWYTAVMLQHLYVAVGLAGLLQMTAGFMRLGKFIRMVPHSVMLGFVNGLAIIIFLSQFAAFKTLATDSAPAQWLPPATILVMLILIAITMTVIILLPRFTKAVPAPLAGILVCSAIVACGVPTPLIGV